MASQWQNFLRNLGDWRGSFARLDGEGRLLSSSDSILTLEAFEGGQLVQFRLRRFGPTGPSGEPLQDTRQDYRTLGKQVVFFENGSFSKGSLQIAPKTPFGAEWGFVGENRRLRLVQLHNDDGGFESLVLIREFRHGSDAIERPPLEPPQLVGEWRGQAATIVADWPEPSLAASHTSVELEAGGPLRVRSSWGSEQHQWQAELAPQPKQPALEPGFLGRRCPLAGAAGQVLLLADGGFCLGPERVSHREAFELEAGWLEGPGRWQRLIRRYNGRGEWISSTHVLETR